MRTLIALTLSLACNALPAALAQTAPAPAQAPQTPAQAPAAPACKELRGRSALAPQLFHGSWRGTRAGKPVQISLRNNEDMPGSLEGTYPWQGRSVALAGDNDGLALNLEESDDNTRISGVWELKLCNDVITGQWLDANFENAQAVSLRRVQKPAPHTMGTSP